MDLPPVPCCALVLMPKYDLSEGYGATYVAAGEVASLKHEVRNNTVKLGVGIAEALLAGAKSAKVLCRLGNDIVKELEVDASILFWKIPLSAIVPEGQQLAHNVCEPERR
jgi:hypothetical protein